MSISRRNLLIGTVATSVTAISACVAFAQNASTPAIYAENGIAIDGTDAVAYFTDGAATPGDAAITFTYMGATWRFATQTNRDAFIASPETYAPQYGGYCAYAVSRGYTASTIPDAWNIIDGKLYLNFSIGVKNRWERDVPGNIAKANANWPDVLG